MWVTTYFNDQITDAHLIIKIIYFPYSKCNNSQNTDIIYTGKAKPDILLHDIFYSSVLHLSAPSEISGDWVRVVLGVPVLDSSLPLWGLLTTESGCTTSRGCVVLVLHHVPRDHDDIDEPDEGAVFEVVRGVLFLVLLVLGLFVTEIVQGLLLLDG